MELEYKVYEDMFGDIVCELPDGYKARFFFKGLSDEEYIKRTKQMQEMDNTSRKFNAMKFDLANRK